MSACRHVSSRHPRERLNPGCWASARRRPGAPGAEVAGDLSVPRLDRCLSPCLCVSSLNGRLNPGSEGVTGPFLQVGCPGALRDGCFKMRSEESNGLPLLREETQRQGERRIS